MLIVIYIKRWSTLLLMIKYNVTLMEVKLLKKILSDTTFIKYLFLIIHRVQGRQFRKSWIK